MTTPQRARLLLGGGWLLAYCSLLAPVVAYTVLRFGSLYSADSLTTEPWLSEQYKTFVGISGLVLAIALALGAATFGVWRRSILEGAAALVFGAATTIVALSVVPLVRFAEDQYPPAALWVMADGGPLLIAFAVASVAGWLLTRARNLETRPI